MTTEKQSTPITAEGLRGLGFELANAIHGRKWTYWARSPMHGASALKLNVYRWNASDGYSANIVMRDGDSVDEVCLGTATDLEWVAAMIGLLRAANGEGRDGDDLY